MGRIYGTGSLEFDDGSGELPWVPRVGFVSAENHSARATRSFIPVLPALSSIAFTPALVGEVLGSQDFFLEYSCTSHGPMASTNRWPFQSLAPRALLELEP